MMHTLRHVVGRWQWDSTVNRIYAGVFAVVLMCLVAGVPAHASVQEIRVVGVGVDSSSAEAQVKALDYAKKRAVYLAARKLGVKDAGKVVAKFTDDQYKQILRGAMVMQSRRVGYITYLEVNVTIVGEALHRALKLPDDYGKTITPQMDMRGVLLLPVLAGKDRAYVWEKDNTLRGPLADAVRRQSQGGVLMAGGDLEDLKLIDYQNALSVKSDELKPMFERYGAEEIIIAVLTLSQNGTTDASSTLLRRLKPDGERNELLEIPVENVEETGQIRLAKAASAIAGAVTQIATSTAERDEAIRQKAKKLKVRFSYVTPKDLARMQDAVRKSPEVLYLDLPNISLSQVVATVYLKGDDEKLRTELTKQGVIVTVINEGWRLSLR